MGRNTSIRATAMLVAAAMAFSLAAFTPSESFAATTNGKAQFWRGSIANLQLDDEGNPDWIQSGTWYVKISPAPSSSAEEGRPNVKFLAQMTMVQLDGTAAHKHRVSNLVLSNYATTSNASLMVEGNATVTMRDGPVENVPVKVSVTGRSVAIWVGPEMIDSHFGEAPMYGTVSRVPSGITAQSYSVPESPGPAPSASTSTSTSNSTSRNNTTNSTSTTSNNDVPAANNNNSTSSSTTATTSSGNSTSTTSSSSNSTSTSAAGNQSSSSSSSSSSSNNNSASSNSTSSNSTSNTSSPSNSTQSSSSPPPATSTTGSNSTTPAQPTGTTNSISLAARPALDLYSWFSGEDENPTLRVAANSDTTIAITNETERKHKLIIQSQDGTQLAASQDVLVGQSGQLVFKPTSAGTLQYMCDYHSPMKGTIEVT